MSIALVRSVPAFDQWQVAQIGAVDEQRIKRQEMRPVAPVQQMIEPARSIRRQTGDLAVENRAARTNRVRDVFGKFWPALEPVTVARDQLAVMAGDVRQCERFGERRRRIGRIAAGFESRMSSPG